MAMVPSPTILSTDEMGRIAPPIFASVGRSGENRPGDVFVIQSLLNDRLPRPHSDVPVTGEADIGTVLAIEAFVSFKDLSLPIVAALCGLVGLLISPDNMLMIGMSLYFVSLIVRFLCPPLDRALRFKVGADNAASREVE